MRMESSQSMEMPNFAAPRGNAAAPKTVSVQNNFAQEYALTITNAANGNRGMEMEILAFEIEAGQGNQRIDYDSRNQVVEQSGPFADVFNKVIGGKLYCLISSDDKVLQVAGVSELIARATAESPGDNPPPGRRAPLRGAATTLLTGIYNEDGIKQMVEFTRVSPETAHVGDSWPANREISSPMVGKFMLNMTNTFRGWQDHDGKKCARIEFTGTIDSSENGAAQKPMRMTVQDGTLKGRYWFSPELKMSIETELDQEYTIHASAGTNGNAGRGANFNFTAPVQQKVSLKLLDVRSR
jgi:hypothetical protein